MYHNYEEGNLVRLKSNGQVMKIVSVRKNPFDDTLSGYIVCEWKENASLQSRTFRVNEVEFISVGTAKPYDVDDNPSGFIW